MEATLDEKMEANSDELLETKREIAPNTKQ